MASNNLILNTALIGEIKLYAGSTIPGGWLVCDGSAVSRTTYARLFNVIGTTYGSGDGSTTFNLPDFKGRTAIGVGESSATGHTAHILGQMSGEETHLLTANESGLPQHAHAIQGGSTTVDRGQYAAGTTYNVGSLGGTANAGPKNATSSHNNMQPYTCINYIIYASISE